MDIAQLENKPLSDLTQADVDTLIASRPSAAELKESAAEFESSVDKAWFAEGTVSIISFALYSRVTVELEWPNEVSKTFKAGIWGVGLGAADGVGTGPWKTNYVPPSNVNMYIDLTIISDGAGAVIIYFREYDTKKTVGQFVGGSLGLEAFSGGGVGKWK